jgi:alanyl-tRNA synthetase
LYAAAVAGADGVRRAMERGPITEETRVKAQAFTGLPKAAYLAVSEDPPALLLATSADAGLHAGNLVKEAVAAAGGRGGGGATLGQGSVPAAGALAGIAAGWGF